MVNYSKKYGVKIGDVGWITLNGEKLFIAKIVGYKDERICDIPIEVLKMDAEYDGFTIHSHGDFVDLLNSFTPYKSNRLSTKKRIFYLTKMY